MTNQTVTDILDQMANTEPSGWLQKAQWRQENKEWLDRSAKIAIRILSQLRNNKKTGKNPANQKELADLMGASPQYINKIVKGNENLTLETIARLEAILQSPLLDDKNSETTIDFLGSSTVSYVAPPQMPVQGFDFQTMQVQIPPTKNPTDTTPNDSKYAYATAA
ncbi:MAG TPA: hypothetical protein DCR35_08675 [Runella sp.]|nr:hypothetical protein [Runella sp.]HAO49359.1 hypothetical protein [Runella sp.]